VNAAAPRPRVWFADTASLLTMAVDEGVCAAVLEHIGAAPVIVIDVVMDELEYRGSQPETATLAATAIATLPASWQIADSSRYVTIEDVFRAQDDVADGRYLKDSYQHWAESTIIAMARAASARGATRVMVLLSEDYDARRVAAGVPNTTSVSVHGVLHAMVQAGAMTPDRAAELAKLLEEADRGREVTADDFADPTGRGLGRVGQPPFRR
jgi:hypothetical protein